MTVIMFDFSFAWPALLEHLEQLPGISAGILRYLSGTPGKDLHPDEIVACEAHGLAIGLVHETSGRPDLSGYAGGRRHCAQAYGQAESLGVPAGTVIFWASDSPGLLWGDVRPYAQGWADEAAARGNRYVTGAYGHERIWRPALAEGLAAVSWQPETWTDSDVQDAHIIQRVNSRDTDWGGASVDENLVQGAVPVWHPPAPTPTIVNPEAAVVTDLWVHQVPAGPAPAGTVRSETVRGDTIVTRTVQPTTNDPGDDDMYNCVQAEDETLYLVRPAGKAPVLAVLEREAGVKAPTFDDVSKALADLADAGQLRRHDGALWAPIGWPALACVEWHPGYEDLRPS